MATPWSSWKWEIYMELNNQLKNKVCVITGANAGIGFEISKSLAASGAEILMICRNLDRGTSAREKIINTTQNSLINLFIADLSLQSEVRRVSNEIINKYPSIDLLINNAGTVEKKRILTAEGFEKTFAINHLAPFLLTNLLQNQLKYENSARIITISSGAHHMGKIDFENLQGEKGFSPFSAYSRTKLANILFTRELSNLLNGTNLLANCLHPGVVHTGIWQFSSFMRFISPILGSMMLSPEKGAKTAIWAATSQEAGNYNGTYFEKCKPASISSDAEDALKASILLM